MLRDKDIPSLFTNNHPIKLGMVPKIVTLFCIKNIANGKSKKVKTRREFDDDFKAEIFKMRSAAHLNSGKNVPE